MTQFGLSVLSLPYIITLFGILKYSLGLDQRESLNERVLKNPSTPVLDFWLTPTGFCIVLSQYSRVILVFSDSFDFLCPLSFFFCLYQWWQVYLFLDYFFNCPPLKEGQNGMVERDGACISGYPLKLSNACVLLISTWYRSFYFWSTILMQTKVLS